jgi:hypothetical protein
LEEDASCEQGGGYTMTTTCRVDQVNTGRVAHISGLLVSLCILTILSCSQEQCSCPSVAAVTSGRVVVDATIRRDEQGSLYFRAFSFSQGTTIRIPNEEGLEPDIIVMITINEYADPSGVFFVQNGLSDAFSYVGRGSTECEGRALLNNLSCIPDSADFTSLADVSPYEVWSVRTHDGRFGKVLIIDTFFFRQDHDSAGTTLARYYGETTFDWVFQPDGGRCFE